MYKIKSLVLLVFLLFMLIGIGFIISNNNITGGTIAGSISCFNDQHCDDNIPETEDLCRNPGTEYSLCVNKPIE